jgi:hypothetical protein
MKTKSSTIAPLRDSPTTGPAIAAPVEAKRSVKRTLGAALPALGRRLGLRPSTTNVRAPLQRLEEFSARNAPAPAQVRERFSLGQLMSSDKEEHVSLAQLMLARREIDAAPEYTDPPPAPVRANTPPASARTDAAPAARPKAFSRLASGPKIDCMADTLTSMDRLDEQQVSQITEALGMGPAAAPGRERDAQLKAAGRLLRAPLEQEPPVPDGRSLGRTQFGRGMPPDVLASLARAARAANCFISERQVTGADGKTVNLLQVHLANRADQIGEPLTSQPNSANHYAVQQLAARFAEALSPIIRTDEQEYRIEYVACFRAQGGSADVFTDQLARQMPMSYLPARTKLTSDHYTDATIRTSRLFNLLPSGERDALVRAAHVAHMAWDEKVGKDEYGNERLEVRVMFGGTQNMRDVGQAFSSIGQSVGKVFTANRDAAVLVAKAVEAAYAKGRNVKFDYIAGGSMGGASAQLFAAAVESRVKLYEPAPLILFDPQLPNQAQAHHAIKDGKLGYDYAKPRGIAITLDYADRSRKSLMGRMKGLGFKSPGLVRLKLGLSAYDRTKYLPNGETERRPPRTSGPPGMGYHADPGLYEMAINRFTGLVGLRR